MLFDLAGDGRVQFQYPYQDKGYHDPLEIPRETYPLRLNVAEPLGEDDLVAVFCPKPQSDAMALLRSSHEGDAPAPETLLPLLGQDCQIGRYGFFTVP